MTRSTRLFAILAILITIPGLTVAQISSVFEDEITVTATGRETQTEELPLPVTIIDRQEIEDSQSESVAEVLNRVAGVTVLQSGAEASVTSVFTRGTESDHTLVLFDGVRLNSPYFGGFDWSQSSTAGLDRIEVARGPYSALWGADAIGGVINMIPGRAPGAPGGELVFESGSDDWRRYEGHYGFSSGAFDGFISGITRQGDQELVNSDFETTEFIGDFGYSWAPGSRIAIIAQDLESDMGIPFSGADATPNRRQETDNRLIAVPLRWRLSDDWRLELTASRVSRELGFSDPDDPFGFTFSQTTAETDEYRLASHHNVGKHALSWGGNLRNDEVADDSSYGTNLDGASSDIAGVFVQDLWQISNRLRLILGARWDTTDEWGSEVSPRFNLGWMLSNETELRVGYGEAFRQPSVGELYFPGSGNPELEAERSTSYELGITHRDKAMPLTWEINLFATDLENLIDFNYATYAFANTAKADIKGAEFIVRYRVAEQYTNILSATYLDTDAAPGQAATGAVDDWLLRRPEISASYVLTGKLWEDVRGSFSVLYVGRRVDVDPVSFENAWAGSYTTANLSLSWLAYPGVEMTVRFLNLTDESYQQILGYPAPGRRVLAGLRIEL